MNKILELHNDDVQEVIGEIPHWIIRWGITIITLTILFLLSLSWFIKYPKTVAGSIVLTTQNPPIDIIARSMGRLNLLVTEEEEVVANQILGYIENSSNFEDMIELIELIDENMSGLNRDNFSFKFKKIEESKDLSLGELQASFESFQSEIRALELFYNFNSNVQKIDDLFLKIDDLKIMSNRYIEQKALLLQEFKYLKKEFDSDSILYSQGYISERDINTLKLKLIQSKGKIKDTDIMILNNNTLIKEYESNIREIELEKTRQEMDFYHKIDEKIKVLKSQYFSWEQSYLLKSPFQGTITFSEFLVDDQFIESNQVLMTVIPKSMGIFGVAKIQVSGSGTVKENQRVNISIENYPANEYGMITGIVTNIAPVPRDSYYTLQIELPKGLETSYGKILSFRQEMEGSANIITEDLRVIERVFYQLRGLVNRM